MKKRNAVANENAVENVVNGNASILKELIMFIDIIRYTRFSPSILINVFL